MSESKNTKPGVVPVIEYGVAELRRLRDLLDEQPDLGPDFVNLDERPSRDDDQRYHWVLLLELGRRGCPVEPAFELLRRYRVDVLNGRETGMSPQEGAALLFQEHQGDDACFTRHVQWRIGRIRAIHAQYPGEDHEPDVDSEATPRRTREVRRRGSDGRREGAAGRSDGHSSQPAGTAAHRDVGQPRRHPSTFNS